MNRFDAESFAESATINLEPCVADVPGMTSAAERRLNYWFASRAYRSDGAIIDLGSFVGSSTAALAAGLVENRKGDGRAIDVYDLFEMQDYMRGIVPDVPTGDSLLPLFEAHVAPWRSRLRVHAGDVTQIGWRGESIEYLLVDLMKSWDLAAYVAAEFFPHLIPGESLVVHQDYLHYYTGWIHLLMYRLRDCFEAVFVPPDQVGGTVVFRTVRTPTRSACRAAGNFDRITLSEIDRAFEYSSGFAPPLRRVCIAATKVTLLWHLDQRRAEKRVELDFSDPLAVARKELQSLGADLHSADEDLSAAIELIGLEP